MKRRGFLKMLGIGAAVPAMAQMPESKAGPSMNGATALNAFHEVCGIGPMTRIEGPDGSYIYGAANPADWYDAQGNQKRVMVCMTATPSVRVAQYEKTEWQYKTVK